ncbi:MAG TPA: glycosyltransferase [Thermoanaerobaculia bacterium]
MRVLSVTRDLEVLCRNGAETESTGKLFAGYTDRRVEWTARALASMARGGWIPESAARPLLRGCRDVLSEALLARDPDAMDLRDLKWGPQLREVLSETNAWPWIRAEASGPAQDARPAPGEDGPEPLVSIVLPTYNGIRFLKDSIESCLAQTHRNLELVVVDDGSALDVSGVVATFDDPRVRLVRHEKNQGVAAGLNTGFANSRGRYLTWTSDDNRYAPEAIETLVRFLRKYPEIAFVYAQSRLVDENDVVTGLLPIGPPESLHVNNFIGACFLYRREVYEGVGEYRKVFLAEDYDYWVRVLLGFRMQRLLKPLYFYRTHPESLTARFSSKDVDERVRHVKRMNRFGARKNRPKERFWAS